MEKQKKKVREEKGVTLSPTQKQAICHNCGKIFEHRSFFEQKYCMDCLTNRLVEAKSRQLFDTLEDDEIFILSLFGSTNIKKTKTNIQKEVFEMKQKLIEFEEYDYGSYSERLDIILEDFYKLGIIKQDSWMRWDLTEIGHQLFHLLQEENKRKILNP